MGIFLIIKNLNNDKGKNFKRISNFFKQGIISRITFSLSKYAYGIFLTHVIIVDIFINIGLLNVDRNAVLWIPFLTIVCLIIDMGLLFIMDQIPIFKKFSGSH